MHNFHKEKFLALGLIRNLCRSSGYIQIQTQPAREGGRVRAGATLAT